MRVLNSKLKILFKLRKEFKILNDKKWKRSVDLTNCDEYDEWVNYEKRFEEINKEWEDTKNDK